MTLDVCFFVFCVFVFVLCCFLFLFLHAIDQENT